MHKKMIFILLIFVSVFTVQPFADKTLTLNIAPLKDMAQEAEGMKQSNQVMLVVFSSPYCIFCEKIINLHLPEIQKDPRFAGKVIYRNVDYDNPQSMMVDAEDEFVTVKEFSAKYDVDFFPVVIFIDEKGKELSEKIKGYDSADVVEKKLINGLLKSIAQRTTGKS